MSKIDDLLSALHGKRGELNAWLESRDEKEVRTAILAIVSPQETLRDKFAARAMQGMFANPNIVKSNCLFNEGNFKKAWAAADAMLKAREAKP